MKCSMKEKKTNKMLTKENSNSSFKPTSVSPTRKKIDYKNNKQTYSLKIKIKRRTSTAT